MGARVWRTFEKEGGGAGWGDGCPEQPPPLEVRGRGRWAPCRRARRTAGPRVSPSLDRDRAPAPSGGGGRTVVRGGVALTPRGGAQTNSHPPPTSGGGGGRGIPNFNESVTNP